ncbi:MAG: hypothetical protein NUW06_06180 [Candidatus Acetothermia bacterium]|jgi:hypothetical protein|nr:hypothetical protein [Candidatus Acetothermia bacterium]MDH7505601.1 hypothetical protein [Candidatus Acetothermia bacterium]
MARCAHCGKVKGTRNCPALRGLICSRCCGEHRGIEIDCPASCPYYQKSERYQRERLAPEFHRRWLEAHGPLYRDGRERVLDFILFLELLLYRYYRERTGGTDSAILEGLEFAKERLGPILLVEGTVRPGLGEYLLEEIDRYLEQGQLSREEALEGLEATLAFLKSFAREAENPRRYLQGLMGHVEQDFDLPEEEEEAAAPTGLIITPDQLREELSRQPNRPELP